jgi:hypothetical protein
MLLEDEWAGDAVAKLYLRVLHLCIDSCINIYLGDPFMSGECTLRIPLNLNMTDAPISAIPISLRFARHANESK